MMAASRLALIEEESDYCIGNNMDCVTDTIVVSKILESRKSRWPPIVVVCILGKNLYGTDELYDWRRAPARKIFAHLVGCISLKRQPIE